MLPAAKTTGQLIRLTMGAAAIPVGVVTGFWAVVGIIFPFLVPKGPNRGVTQVVLVLTAASSWLFWLLCYMHQMNPLIGPQLHNTTVLAIRYLWDGSLALDDLTTDAPHMTEPSTEAVLI